MNEHNWHVFLFVLWAPIGFRSAVIKDPLVLRETTGCLFKDLTVEDHCGSERSSGVTLTSGSLLDSGKHTPPCWATSDQAKKRIPVLSLTPDFRTVAAFCFFSCFLLSVSDYGMECWWIDYSAIFIVCELLNGKLYAEHSYGSCFILVYNTFVKHTSFEWIPVFLVLLTYL